jgi:hypothetical protein
MHTSGKSSTRSSLIRSVALLAILICGFYMVRQFSRHGLPAQIASFINTDADVTRQKIVQMSEAQQDSIRKLVAGFWVSEFKNQNGTVRKSDHLEIRDNGIIWQVINWAVTFPSEDTLSMYLARNGYLIPHGKRSEKSGYACDVRIIRQTFIIRTDTCYGASQVDELWSMEKSPDGLICNDRSFSSYTGKIVEFFPEGMIDLVDKLITNGCAPGYNLQSYARDAICAQLKSLDPIEFNKETMRQWISHYYDPLIVDDILHSQMLFSIPESLTVSFGISADGKVTESRIKYGTSGRVSQLLMQSLSRWEFPRHNNKEKVPTIDYTFHLSGN